MATDGDDYQVRVLDTHKYQATQRLQQGCATLTDKVEQLNGLVRTYLDILDKQVGSTRVSAVSPYSTFWRTATHIQYLQAGKIETEKLKAIGVRNAVATLEEDKKRKAKELHTQVDDKQQQLERLNVQEASLMRAKHDQEALIAKLTDSTAHSSE
ncbi:MAG: intraflagellar transport particle [Trebouxia sp. A1-2]|nr:MAG: intraflagellar transport particle [Trebouxia sp. A1-2]